jgi:hypothetical protein
MHRPAGSPLSNALQRLAENPFGIQFLEPASAQLRILN